jgi:2-dehydro-3-deoxygluconokinase
VTRVLVVGEPLVELLEEPSGAVRRGFGGDALNLAVYLARVSPTIHVILATAVGSDTDSDALLSLSRDERIDDRYIRRVAGAELGRYRVTIDGSGERTFMYERSESPFRDALAGDEALPDPGSIDALCFSGIAVAVLRDARRTTLFGYAEAVRKAGGMVVYDPNHRPALWADDPDAREWTARIAPIADVLIASAEDGRELMQVERTVEIARAFHAIGAREVVVTDGPGPCVVSYQGAVATIDAVSPLQVIDTTAAGDAFDAGYIAARLRGETPERSAAVGHASAATVVGHRGALAPRPVIS